MTNPDYTHLALIADRSGSMSSIADDMNGGIHQLLVDQAQLPGELTVDITVFDTLIEDLYLGVGADDVKEDLIVPRGGTALNDAIGVTCTKLGARLAAMQEEKRPGKVIVVIVTDGQENSSHEWTVAAVKKLVTKQQKDFSWEFLFLGANIDSFAVGGGYGVPQGSTLNWSASGEGVFAASAAVSSYATRSRLQGDTTGFTEDEQKSAS